VALLATTAKAVIASLSSRTPGFSPRPVHVGILVDEVALGQVSLRVRQFPRQFQSTNASCSFTLVSATLCRVILAVGSVVKMHLKTSE
jgi:hypothetical protein